MSKQSIAISQVASVLAISALVLLNTIGANSQQVLIGPEIGPTSLYGSDSSGNGYGFFSWSQTGMKSDTFAYRYFTLGGFDY